MTNNRILKADNCEETKRSAELERINKIVALKAEEMFCKLPYSAEKFSMAKFRMGKAQSHFRSAKKYYENGDYIATVNSSHYAMLYAARSALTLYIKEDEYCLDTILLFERTYVQNGRIDGCHLRRWQDLYVLLQKIAYDDFFAISKKDIFLLLENTQEFLDCVEDCIADYYSNTEEF